VRFVKLRHSPLLKKRAVGVESALPLPRSYQISGDEIPVNESVEVDASGEITKEIRVADELVLVSMNAHRLHHHLVCKILLQLNGFWGGILSTNKIEKVRLDRIQTCTITARSFAFTL